MPLVQAIELEKRYVDGPAVVSVLEGLDLDIEPGARIAIVGESGVGKSTLLHLLGALDRPTAGRILFDGDDVFARREPDLAGFRNREVGFVFQFHHLLPDFTALENVMLPALIAGEAFRDASSRATALLERVGLQARLAHRPGQLSGGEQQRVAVARALIHAPAVVWADEPTGNLDSEVTNVIVELLVRMNNRGQTIVLVTHNPLVSDRAQRTVRMRDGRIETPLSDVAEGAIHPIRQAT